MTASERDRSEIVPKICPVLRRACSETKGTRRGRGLKGSSGSGVLLGAPSYSVDFVHRQVKDLPTDPIRDAERGERTLPTAVGVSREKV